MTVQAIPQGFHSLTPGLTCKDAAKAIEVYKKAFGATERSRFAGPDGKIMHAELQIGDSMIFLADESPGMSAAPTQGAPPSQAVYMYVPNVDATYDQAVAAGCQGAMPVSDMFWGDRFGKVIDPFGHHWNLAMDGQDGQHVEVRWAKLGPRRKSGWEPLKPSGSHISTSVRSCGLQGTCGPCAKLLLSGKGWPINGIEPS